MTIARKLLSAAAAASLLAAAACTTTGPSEPPAAAAPKGVEGNWIDGTGQAVSTFSSGKYTTVAAQTGEKFAEGTYTMTGATSLEITGTSLIRQTPIHTNCLLVSINQLNCTDAAGKNFVFTRRS
ncbi:hypothetical protein [Mesorhizobium atlanticum]|uniref:Outer membrane lipoprotein omp10 n=1 Tax=Mesorhizobium atlanticum TaxID=2233532 RepID=A0A330GX80_9HYPH|nr:hypothetical protein [Mesorhizobium atlanticum]RAZ78272.1 hypothetical protein DPM35_06740 [Mesorhizobium atlanticum]